MQTALLMQALEVAERAAIAAAEYSGRGDKHTADQVATEAMREAFNAIDFAGRIVIGEGERDEAPMLFIGEQVGKGWLRESAGESAVGGAGAGAGVAASAGAGAPGVASAAADTGDAASTTAAAVEPAEQFDIAVDPLEGTNLCAYNRPNAVTTLAIAPQGALLAAPDTYMWKLAAGPAAAATGLLHIDKSPAENIQIVADALGKPIADVNVCILLRDRHDELIAQVRATGARIRLIDDGDVFGAIATAIPNTGYDIYLGSGGAPEGVLAAAGLKAIGGFFMGRLAFELDKDGASKRARAELTAGVDLDAALSMDDLVRSDNTAFIATGVTDGEMLAGVQTSSSGAVTTSSVVMNSADKSIRFIQTTRHL